MRKTKRQTIGLAMDPRQGPSVHAIDKVAVMEGVLAAHRVVNYEGGLDVVGKYWVITHVPSGYNLGVHYKTQRHAKKVMDLLLDLPDVDWDSADVEVIRSQGGKEILKILEKYMVNEPEDV